MEIRARDANRELLLEFSGDIDHHGARNALKEVEMAIDASLPRLLILDFSGVTFMDSSGIGLLMGRYRALGMRGKCVQVMNVNSHIAKLLRLSGVGRYIDICKTQEAAELLRPLLSGRFL